MLTITTFITTCSSPDWRRKQMRKSFVFLNQFVSKKWNSTKFWNLRNVKAKTKLKRLLKEYKDIFCEELPDGLPPKRAVDHAIDHSPVNKNAYPLSVQQLQEQVRQIEDLLKRGLIRESISP